MKIFKREKNEVPRLSMWTMCSCYLPSCHVISILHMIDSYD